ncbi:MAG: hypothetical protein ACP5O4_06475 [bacterium]
MDSLSFKDELIKINRENIIGDFKEEFKIFRSEVSSQLEGFKIAIESINHRINSIESIISSIENKLSIIKNFKLPSIENKINKTNKRIDETNKRIDNIQFRLDDLYNRYTDLNLLVNYIYKEIINDLTIRVENLERKVS